MHACMLLCLFLRISRKLVEDSKGIALISPAARCRRRPPALLARTYSVRAWRCAWPPAPAREGTRSVQSLWNFPLAPPRARAARTYALDLHAPGRQPRSRSAISSARNTTDYIHTRHSSSSSASLQAHTHTQKKKRHLDFVRGKCTYLLLLIHFFDHASMHIWMWIHS